MRKRQGHDEGGKFTSPYSEPLSKERIGVRFPNRANERLKRIAEARGVTLTEVVREAAMKGLRELEGKLEHEAAADAGQDEEEAEECDRILETEPRVSYDQLREELGLAG